MFITNPCRIPHEYQSEEHRSHLQCAPQPPVAPGSRFRDQHRCSYRLSLLSCLVGLTVKDLVLYTQSVACNVVRACIKRKLRAIMSKGKGCVVLSCVMSMSIHTHGLLVLSEVRLHYPNLHNAARACVQIKFQRARQAALQSRTLVRTKITRSLVQYKYKIQS